MPPGQIHVLIFFSISHAKNLYSNGMYIQNIPADGEHCEGATPLLVFL